MIEAVLQEPTVAILVAAVALVLIVVVTMRLARSAIRLYVRHTTEPRSYFDAPETIPRVQPNDDPKLSPETQLRLLGAALGSIAAPVAYSLSDWEEQ